MTPDLEERLRHARPAVPAPTEETEARLRRALLAREQTRGALARAMAGGVPPRPALRRRRRVAVVAAAVGLAGVAVGSALGVGDRLLDLIAGQPAPAPIMERLVDEATAERITPLFGDVPNAAAQGAHGVLAVSTSGGPVALWTIPTRDGPVCFFVEIVRLSERAGTPQGDSRCTGHPSPTAPIIWTETKRELEGRTVRFLAGPLAANVGSLWLRAPDGNLRRVAIAERFFLVEVPALDERHALLVRDREGKEIERVSITDFTAGVFNRMSPRVTGLPRVVIDTEDTKGKPLRLVLQPVEGGRTCLSIVARNGRGTGCAGPEKLRAPEGISVHATLAGSMIYLQGSVGPEIASLTLEYEDGRRVELPVVERFVLFDIAREDFVEGRRPLWLIGRDADGAELARERIRHMPIFGPKSSIWLPGEVSP